MNSSRAADRTCRLVDCVFKEVHLTSTSFLKAILKEVATIQFIGGPTKHRTDRTDHTDRTGREIAAGKAQINYRDLVINLYTAYHAMHDEFSQ